MNAFIVANEHLKVAEREVFEHEADILVFCGKDGEEGDDVGMGELLQVLQLAHGVWRQSFGVFFLLLDLLDGDELGGVGAGVAQVDNGVGTFTELLACMRPTSRG